MCSDLLTIGVLQYQQKQLQEDDTPEARELSRAIHKFIKANYPDAWYEPNETEIEGD